MHDWDGAYIPMCYELTMCMIGSDSTLVFSISIPFPTTIFIENHETCRIFVLLVGFKHRRLDRKCNMRKTSFLVIILFILNSLGSVCAQPLVIKGIYQGKDLYIKNPFAPDGVGFCINDVYVNDQLTRDEVNSSAFAIDFQILGIKVGTPLEVVINHKDGCKPMILNPESIKPHSTYEITDIGVKGKTLTWAAKNERGSLPYVIEQYRWNKWVKAGEVPGDGTADETTYSLDLDPYFGENKVRVKQTDYTGKPKYSKSVTFNPGTSKITFSPQKPDTEIKFSGPTRFEIFDVYGNLVKTGLGKSVDVADLQSGATYYLNYDNSFGETFRKK